MGGDYFEHSRERQHHRLQFPCLDGAPIRLLLVQDGDLRRSRHLHGAAENGSVLLNEEARTGGGYFLISPSFLDKYTFNSYAGYTIFEEVYNATGGAPGFNLFCRESYFISNGTEYQPILDGVPVGKRPVRA